MRRAFTLAPDVGVVVHAGGFAARHFAAEYGHGPASPASAVMQLHVGPALRRPRLAGAEHSFAGGHRLARWSVRAGLDGDGGPVTCALLVAGPLGLPLVQSMVVEPLLSLATPGAGRVLLPGALVHAADGPVLVLGRSGTGKSTLALRALAARRAVAADDQILVRADGACAGLSRRLRVYADLPTVVPEAHALLPADLRRRIALAGAVTRLTAGRVSPPVPVSPAIISPRTWHPGRDVRPLRALLLAPGAARASIGGDELVAFALTVLTEQRARLVAAGVRPPADTLERESLILGAALGGLAATRIDLRRASDPLGAVERAVAA